VFGGAGRNFNSDIQSFAIHRASAAEELALSAHLFGLFARPLVRDFQHFAHVSLRFPTQSSAGLSPLELSM